MSALPRRESGGENPGHFKNDAHRRSVDDFATMARRGFEARP